MSKILRATRNIEVWRGKRAMVEREGSTVSIQVGYPDGTKGAVVMDVETATELARILPDATAIVGAVVTDTEKVGGTSND